MARAHLTAVPATRSSLPVLTIRRRVLLGLIIAAIASGFAGLAAVVASNDEPPPQVVLPTQESVALAQTVVEDYFALRASAVPAVEGVSSDFSGADLPGSGDRAPAKVDSLAYAGSAPYTLGDGQRDLQDIEQHQFNVKIGQALYTVTVVMAKQADSWYLAAAPSIEPARTGPEGATALDYKRLYGQAGGPELLPTEGYLNQIQAWAETFASEGTASPKLLALTGDEGNRTYSGLGGWSVVQEPVIQQVVPVSTPHPGFIVRISLVLAPPAPNGPTLSTDYDLYLRSDRSEQQPPVVAWGPAGSYRSLVPYMNADPQR
jgi:hypothetical protein